MPARRGPSRRLVGLMAAVVGLAAVLFLGYMLWPGAGAPIATPGSGQPTSKPLRIGELEIGEYVSDGFTPAVTLAVTDPGWSLTAQRTASMDLLQSGELPGRLSIARLTGVTTDPCNPDGTYPIATGASPEDLVSALREVADTYKAERNLDYLTDISDAVPIEIDRRPGLRVDFRVSSGVFAACDPGTDGVSLFPLGSHAFEVQPETWVRLEAIPVDGRTVSFISVFDSMDPPITQLEAFRELTAKIVDGVRFQ